MALNPNMNQTDFLTALQQLTTPQIGYKPPSALGNVDTGVSTALQNLNMGVGTGLQMDSVTGQLAGGASQPTGLLASLKRFLPEGFLGTTNADGTKTDGWGGTAIDLATGLGNAYMGMKQFGLAKDQFKHAKTMDMNNYNNQVSLVNQNMEDRQRARAAANPNAVPVDEYMRKNRIGG